MGLHYEPHAAYIRGRDPPDRDTRRAMPHSLLCDASVANWPLLPVKRSSCRPSKEVVATIKQGYTGANQIR